MAFFDKIGELVAKNIGDKGNETAVINRLNSQINAEKAAIPGVIGRLGDFYYRRWLESGRMDEEAAGFFAEIEAHNAAISEAQAEIERVRAEAEAQRVAAQAELERIRLENEVRKAAAQAEFERAGIESEARRVSVQPAAGIICPDCGGQNFVGANFCCECGGKLETPVVPAKLVCPSCGAEVDSGVRFCGRCGTRLEQGGASEN
jgi:NADH pyrophosphatase NudC (nudix superfamily)